MSSRAPASPTPTGAAAEASVNGPGSGHDGLGVPSWLVVAGVAVVVLAGVVLRFSTRSDLWLDEALSVNIASLPVGDMLEALRRDGHPPLYYVLLHGWMELFGSGDLAARSLSGVLAVATLPVAWWAGRRYAGPVGGVALLTLLAVSPFAVRYATEARMYSLVTLLVLLGWLAVRRALDSPTPGRLAPVAVVGGLLLLTHYWAFYLVATVGGLALWRAVRVVDRSERRTAIRLAVAVAGSGLFFLPWAPAFLDQLATTGTPWGVAARPGAVVTFMLRDYGGTLVGESELIGFTLAALVVVAVFGRPARPGRMEIGLRPRSATRPELLTLVGTLSLAVVVGFATQSAFATRYTAVVFPILLLLVSFGITQLPRPAGAVALAALALSGLVASAIVTRTQRTQAAEVASAIEERHDPGDLVVYCPDQLGPGVSRNLPPEMRGSTYPAGEDPRFVNWVDYAERLAATDPAEFARSLEADAPADADIFLVWFGGYRTHAGTCEAIIDELAARRDVEQLVVASTTIFEPSSLYRYGPRTR